MIFKISDYPKNTVMHCKTEEEAKIFTEYLEEQGLKWCTGRKYSEYGTKFNQNKDQTCYNYNSGTYSNMDWYLDEGYNVIEFDDFEWVDYNNSFSLDSTDTSVIDKFLNIFRKGSEKK